MRERSDNTRTGKERISQIMKDCSEIAGREREEIFNQNMRKIKRKAFNENTQKYSKSKLQELFVNLHDIITSNSEKKLITDIWEDDEISPAKKAEFIAKFTRDKTPIPSTQFISCLATFTTIFKTDAELNLFLNNPQDYINQHPNMSAHDLQTLQIVINDPKFNNLPSVNRQVPPDTFIYTPLQAYMNQLKLPEYGSMDAGSFPRCIYPGAEERVLELSKREYHGPQMKSGAGALPVYNREIIKGTASVVSAMKMGVCNSFAQFTANHFLNLIEEGQMAPMHLKIVSYKRHTFLLVGHDSNDLSDLSNCVIIDPWLVTMGHQNTYGVYTIDNYPYPSMTKDLICCYDNQAPVQAYQQQVSDALLKVGLYAKKPAAKAEKSLTEGQIAVAGFIGELSTLCQHGDKKQFFKDLIEDVKNGDVALREGAKLAALAFHAKGFEKTGENTYAWKKGSFPVDELILPAFTSNSMRKFWKNYIKQNNISEETSPKVNAAMLNQIVSILNEKEAHEYKAGPKITHTI